MPATKNLCAQVPIDLHQKISEAREQAGLTTVQYITNLLLEYYEMKENGGKTTMANNNTRTLAFQVGADFFQRVKNHLDRESARLGRTFTQKEFVLGLIEEALEAAERQAGEANPEPGEQPQEEAGAGPCEAQPDEYGAQDPDAPSQDDAELYDGKGRV